MSVKEYTEYIDLHREDLIRLDVPIKNVDGTPRELYEIRNELLHKLKYEWEMENQSPTAKLIETLFFLVVPIVALMILLYHHFF